MKRVAPNPLFSPLFGVSALVLAAILGGGGPAPCQDSAAIAKPDAPSEIDELFAALRREFPGRDDVQQGAAEIIRRIGMYIAGNPEAAGVVRVRRLLAEVLELVGRRKDAQDEWRALAKEAPRPEDRARALFLLGASQLLDGKRSLAQRSFGRLGQEHAESSWMRAAAPTLRYLELSQPGQFAPTPEFSAKFERLRAPEKTGDGSTVEQTVHSSSSLEGKVALLYFWRESSPDVASFVDTVARHPEASLERAVKDYPILAGQIVVLGVSLDRSRSAFENGLRRTRPPWPQLHDGKGFDTPLARSFAVPRAPHWVVIGPHGRIWHMGSNLEKFYAYASEAMKRHRVALENAREERPGAKR